MLTESTLRRKESVWLTCLRHEVSLVTQAGDKAEVTEGHCLLLASQAHLWLPRTSEDYLPPGDGGQNTACKSWFSLSTTWALGSELSWQAGWQALDLLSHLMG